MEGRTLSPPRRTGALRARHSIVAGIAAILALSALLAFERYRHRQLDHGYDIRASGSRRAKRELTRARAEGIDVSADREEAELLAYELGLPHHILPADPPYPNNLRYLAIFELENRAGSNLPQ